MKNHCCEDMAYHAKWKVPGAYFCFGYSLIILIKKRGNLLSVINTKNEKNR